MSQLYQKEMLTADGLRIRTVTTETDTLVSIGSMSGGVEATVILSLNDVQNFINLLKGE